MKIKYLAILLLVLGLGFQVFRIKKLKEMIPVGETIYENITYTSDENIPKGEIKYLILISEKKSLVEDDILANLKEIFGYAKINYDVKIIKDLEKDEIKEYESIIIATENYKFLRKDSYQEIKKRVTEGKNLIILNNSYYNPFNKFSGIKKINGYQEGQGLTFEKHIFPGIDEIKIIGKEANNITNSLLKVELYDDVEIIAKTASGFPLIFKRDIGKGRVIYSNSTFFVDRAINGILMQLISYGNNFFFQTIVNTKQVDIDDFPAPLPRMKVPSIYSKYNGDTRTFFRKVWWPDMKKMAKEENLVYSGFAIGSYEDITNPKNFNQLNKNDSLDKTYFGRELLNFGGEIGIHGYNHQPLGLHSELNHNHEYNDWDSKEDMKKGLILLKTDLNRLFGGLKIRSYVPPSNMLGLTGKKALRETLPDLEVISGLYSGTTEKGVLITHIGWDKDIPSLYDFPRFTSGLPYSENEMLAMYQGVAIFGIVRHFIHPDDILDRERGKGKKWKKLKFEFQKYFKNINRNFGFLRPMTSYAGFQEALKIEKLKSHVFQQDNGIYIHFENFPGKTYHFFRIRGKKIKKVAGGNYTLITYDGETTLYLIEANRNEISILLK